MKRRHVVVRALVAKAEIGAELVGETRVKKVEPNFLSKLGSPRFIAAPMVQQSDLAFRLLVRRHGCDLAFTQMLHSRNFVKSDKFRDQNWDPLPSAAAAAFQVAAETMTPFESCSSSDGDNGNHHQHQQGRQPAQSPPPPPLWVPPAFVDRPLIAQFAGDDPNVLLEAARYVEEEGVDAIDLNLGECVEGSPMKSSSIIVIIIIYHPHFVCLTTAHHTL